MRKYSYIRSRGDSHQVRINNADVNFVQSFDSLDEAIEVRDKVLARTDEGKGFSEFEFQPTTDEYTSDQVVREVKFGALADTHLGSNYELSGFLSDFYTVLEEENVQFAVHAGNYIEGVRGGSRSNYATVHKHTYPLQFEYAAKEYPEADFPTYFVDGLDHEGWLYKSEGILPGKLFEKHLHDLGRYDLKYLGMIEGEIYLKVPNQKDYVIRAVHPGGGTSQSISLKGQQLAEYCKRVNDTVDMLVIGHYHKADFLPDHYGICVIQAGCFQDTSDFMRQQKIVPHIGGWIVTLKFLKNGQVRTTGEFIPYKRKQWSLNLLSENKAVVL